MTTTNKVGYRPTESKYKGGAHEMFVTYDLEQKTRGGGTATYPKVKRVYIAGDVKDWSSGTVTKRSGKTVHGVRIEYEQGRKRYRRQDETAVGATTQRFTQVVEVPEKAHNVHFYPGASALPQKYKHAVQHVR